MTELAEDAPLTAEERRRARNRANTRRYRERLSQEADKALRARSNAQRRARYATMSESERVIVKAAARARYTADAERQRQGAARRYAANREVRRVQHEAWKIANPERIRELARRGSRAWRARNPDKVRASHAAYRARQRERFRLYWRQRKARRRGATCEDAIAHREYALILLGDPCSYCDAEADTIDHIVPIVGGGSDDWHNLTSACASCNSSKHARSLLEAL